MCQASVISTVSIFAVPRPYHTCPTRTIASHRNQCRRCNPSSHPNMARFLGLVGELGFDLHFHRQHELVTNSDCSNDALMQISRVLSLQTQNLIYIPSGSNA